MSASGPSGPLVYFPVGLCFGVIFVGIYKYHSAVMSLMSTHYTLGIIYQR